MKFEINDMWYGLNRTWCQTLDEMRQICKTGNIRIDMMLSLIEELQVYGNRMEAALGDLSDLEALHREIKEKKAILKKLKAKTEKEGEDV